jgi:uncharacterized membrane protein
MTEQDKLEALATYIDLMAMNGGMQVYHAAQQPGVLDAIGGSTCNAVEISAACGLREEPLLAIASVLTAAVLGAVGQFLIEYGARHGKGGVIGFLTNHYILAGMSGYLLVMVLFTHAFRTGGTIRVLYPLYASTFIWAAFIAWIAYQQPAQPVHVIGMMLLITGMICMSW